MKKIVVSLVVLMSLLNAGWFDVTKDKEEPKELLQPTKFDKFKDQIGKAPMMIEFGSTHCVSCQEMAKKLYKIKQKYPKANIYFVNIYDDMKVAKNYQIRVIPTQKFLDKNGKVIDTHMGVYKDDKLIERLKKLGIIK